MATMVAASQISLSIAAATRRAAAAAGAGKVLGPSIRRYSHFDRLAKHQSVLTPLFGPSSSTCFDFNSRRSFFATKSEGRRFADEDDGGDLVVSILGPPNAGKSTLFNRLMCKEANKSYRLSSEKGYRKKGRARGRVGHTNPSKRVGGAIVSSVPGTTRDRRECIGRIGGTTFKLLDTAGVDGEKIGHLVGKTKNPVERLMMHQTLEAAISSDLILLLFDARVGVTSDFSETARWLRKISNKEITSNNANDDEEATTTQREVILLANKLEGDKWTDSTISPVMDHLMEASRVGFGEPIPISAEHGEGLADVAVIIDELTLQKRERLGLISDDTEEAQRQKSNEDKDGVKPLQLAILGRQNVGKSTLVNSLLKQDRVIVGETPGLTRDAIAVQWMWKDRPVKLVDTAGIRKSTKRDKSNDIEDLAVQDAMRAMKVADVAVLVLDADAKMLQRQELAIADAIIKEGRSLVVVANKMDLLIDEEYTKQEYADAVREQIEIRFPMLRNTPVVPMSSLTGEGVTNLMPVVFTARDRWSQIISTGLLNRWLSDVVDAKRPPMQDGRETKLKYIIQTKGRPPTFLLFCNVSTLPVSYMRYLTRNFQETFKMFGMEVRMAIKKSAVENPFGQKGGSTRGGRGVGGWQGRQKRLVQDLKTTGQPGKKGMRRRKQRR